MSEEIKEINRIIQSIRDFYKMDNALKYYLDRQKAKILLNYITNLQQKVEQLEKENKELKYLVDDSNIMKAFIVEHNKVEQLENIRKEAIEHIEENLQSYSLPGVIKDMRYVDFNKLLNILNKGDNK